MTAWPAKEEMRASAVIAAVSGVVILIAGLVAGVDLASFALFSAAGLVLGAIIAHWTRRMVDHAPPAPADYVIATSRQTLTRQLPFLLLYTLLAVMLVSSDVLAALGLVLIFAGVANHLTAAAVERRERRHGCRVFRAGSGFFVAH